MISFNQAYITGKETHYIYDAVNSKKLSGNGKYTKLCQNFFEERFHFKKSLLTTSCTDALEMCAMLLNIKEGDEIIIPSYTFVSTALAFVRQGAKIIFADSYKNHPNIDHTKIEALITPKTKAIVVVHYAGAACEMDSIMAIAQKHNLYVIEDAAQAIDSYYKGKALGSIGHLATFSFHETKNIQAGEGGLLAINHEDFMNRAEVLWEKGTNRAEFFRGEVNKYGWVDTGSSFLPSEIIAAFLYAQLENLDDIQNKRKSIWDAYHKGLNPIKDKLKLPILPDFATNNAHMYYIVCKNLEERNSLIQHLKQEDIHAVFHYLGLHSSEYYHKKHDGRVLENTDHFENTLLRLPLFYELKPEEIQKIIDRIIQFYN